MFESSELEFFDLHPILLAHRALTFVSALNPAVISLRRLAPARKNRKPFTDLLLSVGAMKAGTSWLFEILKDHPELATTPIKEVHYLWDKYGDFRMLSFEQRRETARFHLAALLPSCDQERSVNLLRWCETYLSDPVDDCWFANIFPDRGERRYCADFSNLTSMVGEDAWRHARSLTDNLRVVYTIRNPLERLWSHASFHASLNGHTADLQGFSAVQFDRYLQEAGCIKQGAYSSVIERLKSQLEAGEWKILFHDDIKERPADLVRDVQLFLGIAKQAVSAEQLAHIHSATKKGAMTDGFIKAARPHVERELAALAKQGTRVPESWSMVQPHH